MKALSLWQPWASLWFTPAKLHETRHWKMQVPVDGVWVAVHAAKRMPSYLEPALRKILEEQFGPLWVTKLPQGAIIGAVRVYACLPTIQIREVGTTQSDLICGNFDPGRYGFCRDANRLLKEPIPYRGQQGFFTVDDAVLDAAGWRS